MVPVAFLATYEGRYGPTDESVQGEVGERYAARIAEHRAKQTNRHMAEFFQAAIFQQEAELLKGAVRLYPILRQYKENLEYGYRLKEFPDEEITLAVMPEATIGDKFQYAFSKAKEYFNSVTKKTK